MSDISLRDLDQAKRWKSDVEGLTEQIQRVLDKIHLTVQECVDRMEGNSVLKKPFTEMWVSLGNAFDKLVSTLQKVVEALQKILDFFVQKTDELKAHISSAVRKIRNG